MACSNSGRPPRTGAFVPTQGGISFHDYHAHVGQMWWLGLPPLQVRRGIRRVTITGLRLAAHYPGVVLVATARFSLAQTKNGLVSLLSPDDLKKFSYEPTGPFVGTTELPGNPVDDGAFEVRFDQPGAFHIENVILSYRTPDGSGEQTITCDFKLTVSGG